MTGSDWESPWDCFQPWDVASWGEVILDRREQERWSRAVFLGGLPWMWRRAAVVRELIYRQAELRPGDRVLLLGESLEPCGFVAEIGERIGTGGELRTVEIIEDARRAYLDQRRGIGGQLATWHYTYTQKVPDEYFDCVVVAQGVQHAEDWAEAGRELLRVMKSGRQIVLAEITFGPNFRFHAESDVHLEYLVRKLFDRIGWDYVDFPYYSPEQLVAAFDGLVRESQTFAWKGIELFWARKPESRPSA